jgi:hypothetical protein
MCADAATVVSVEEQDDASTGLSPADASRMRKAAEHLIAAFCIQGAGTPDNRGRYRFRASMRVQTNDRWLPYRLEAQELPPAVLNRLDQLQAAD